MPIPIRRNLLANKGKWAGAPDQIPPHGVVVLGRHTKSGGAIPVEATLAVPTPIGIAAARSAGEKLRAYWTMSDLPPADCQERLLTKLAQVEKTALSSQES